MKDLTSCPVKKLAWVKMAQWLHALAQYLCSKGVVMRNKILK